MNLRRLLSLAPAFGLSLLIGAGACDSKPAGDAGTTGEGPACEDEWVEKPDLETTEDISTHWGSACSTDADCAHIEDGECFLDTIDVYEIPGGVCSKRCDLPDSGTTVVLDDLNCDPDGGVACMGAKGVFSACLPPCTSNSQCGRAGFGCIRMPVISAAGDASFCLMNPDACCLDPSMCT